MPCGARMEERGPKHSVSLSGERLCLESREYFRVEQMWSEVHFFGGGTSDLACDALKRKGSHVGAQKKTGVRGTCIPSVSLSVFPIEQVVRTPLHVHTDSRVIKKK